MTSNYAYASPEWEHQHASPSAYAFDAENENEIARLLLQDRYLSECMEGVLPISLDLSRVKRVLDASCGAGGWLYELAWKHPSMHVTGIDQQPYFVEQAEELVSLLGNATVMQQDIRHLSDEVLPPESFDLVHARFLVSMLSPQEYPAVLTSLVNRCRVGSLFAWDELEFPITNSPACQTFYALMQDRLKAAGRAFSPGHALGITMMMRSLMQEAGCKVTLDAVSAIEVSRGTKGRDTFAWQMRVLGKQMRSFLLEAGVTTGAFFDELCSQAQNEISNADFCGLIYVRTLVGMRIK
ncbi:MAG: class I SAM-dependent methyltransferase [Ktedonobacteraceae bacterium]